MIKVAISSGHGKYVSGAVGIVNEVKEARIIVNLIKIDFNRMFKGKAECVVFHDDVSKSKNENLKTINAWHKKQNADYDVSVHLNSSSGTHSKAMGVEILYSKDKQKVNAEVMCAAISKATKLTSRGAKKRNDLSVLNADVELLIETYFVNSHADVELMNDESEKYNFANAVALSLGNYLGLIPVNEKYRFKSGTYDSYETMVLQVQKAHKLGIINSKWVTYQISNKQYFWVSGVYENKTQAEKVINQLINNKILSKVHYLKV